MSELEQGGAVLSAGDVKELRAYLAAARDRSRSHDALIEMSGYLRNGSRPPRHPASRARL